MPQLNGGTEPAGGQFSRNDFPAIPVNFATAELRLANYTINAPDQSHTCGSNLARQLNTEGLAGVFILSDRLNVNGSHLVAGFTSVLSSDVPISGGIAGDGAAFKETIVGANRAPRSNLVAAVGFNGPAIRIGNGSVGDWNVFGPRRTITKSEDNKLFELDGEPALDLYERYLGEDDVNNFPGFVLLFPPQISDPDRPNSNNVRTILGIDRVTLSIMFAGDMSKGSNDQLMRGTIDRLVAGSGSAAQQTNSTVGVDGGKAIVVSCIGRRLMMGQRVIDEVEVAHEVLGSNRECIGFYSYGKISPHLTSGLCEFHN